jgi:ABC-type uncharacterized transport system permease subunit
MTWLELLTLLAMVLVSGTIMSVVFQRVKSGIPEKWRALVLYALCLVVAIAQEWLSGDVLGIVSNLNAGVATASEVFAFGSATFGLATAAYNLYVRPKS